MSVTPSTMLPLGTPAPDFHLLNVCTGQHQSLDELKSTVATVIMFVCNHCPYVKLLQKKLVEVANHYQALGVRFIAISSNDMETYPQDGPTAMKHEAEENHYPFPYLFDQSQEVAKAYAAACTPDFYIFDKELHCVYRGRFDEATPGNGKPVTGIDLSSALDAIIQGDPVNNNQLPSHGCNIKWRK